MSVGFEPSQDEKLDRIAAALGTQADLMADFARKMQQVSALVADLAEIHGEVASRVRDYVQTDGRT